MPRRVRVAAGRRPDRWSLLPLLPHGRPAPLLSAALASLITVQQVLIGAALGFALQLVFDALALGGQLLANGMGLGFAFNLDPLRGVSTPALGQLYVVLGTLTFLALDGHLALLQLLARQLPRPARRRRRARPGTTCSALADWGQHAVRRRAAIALPGMTALLVVNLAFGVMSRAAPSLNLFAVGLPVTLVVGLRDRALRPAAGAGRAGRPAGASASSSCARLTGGHGTRHGRAATTSERTESPTPKRLEEARKHGQVRALARPGAAAVTLAGGVGLYLLGGTIGGAHAGADARQSLSFTRAAAIDPGQHAAGAAAGRAAGRAGAWRRCSACCWRPRCWRRC